MVTAKLTADPNPVTFSASDNVTADGAVTFIPVFENQDADSITRFVRKPDIREKLERQFESGFFQAKPGQICDLSADGIILGGLGKEESFHPDTFASLCRSFGKKAVENTQKKWIVALTPGLTEAVEKYSSLYASPETDPFLAKKVSPGRNKPARASKKSAKENEEKSPFDILPDYTGTYDTAHLISQAATSILTGCFQTAVLKSNTKALNKTEVLLHAHGIERSLVLKALRRGADTGRMQNAARKIDSLPGNHLDPAQFETYTRNLAKEFSLKIKVLSAAQLEKGGFGGIISVGKGSAIPPRMVVLEYNPSNAKTDDNLVLVGKGITFDTGGISLKPPGDMHEMKYDMCGAGLVVHAVALAKLRKIPMRVTGLVGLAENMPGPEAVKPGDVYTAYNGTTVEVQNTDAEGRLVLGDVLSYACKNYKPSVLFDFATLTGACVIALGHEAAGVMTRSNALAAKIDTACRSSGDRSWRLPHWSVYDEQLKSDIADVRNIGGKPAGTVTAMRFLSRFVDSHIPWAHFDIAGTAWRSSAARAEPKGATGWGMRFLNEFMEQIAGIKNL